VSSVAFDAAVANTTFYASVGSSESADVAEMPWWVVRRWDMGNGILTPSIVSLLKILFNHLWDSFTVFFVVVSWTVLASLLWSF